MRTIRTAPVVPPTLRSTGAGGKAGSQNTSRNTENVKLEFPSHWNKADVRGILYGLQGCVCGYCGAQLPFNDRGDVEHYRPKGRVTEDKTHPGYWWLAYDIHNYLLSCSRCNRQLKGSKFPLLPGGTYLVDQQAELSGERRALIDPKSDNVEVLIQVKGKFHFSSDSDLNNDNTMRVAETIKLFRLNRNPVLRLRLNTYDSALEALSAGRADVVKQAASRFSAHSLVVRALLLDIRPELVPNAEEELHWHLDSLILGLLDTLAEVENMGWDKLSRTTADELLWSLATLWAHPPDGSMTVNEIADFLEARDVIDFVRPFLSELNEQAPRQDEH